MPSSQWTGDLLHSLLGLLDGLGTEDVIDHLRQVRLTDGRLELALHPLTGFYLWVWTHLQHTNVDLLLSVRIGRIILLRHEEVATDVNPVGQRHRDLSLHVRSPLVVFTTCLGDKYNALD